ncbi:MAG: type II secretion system GspH family protein [Planctomycetaceae bacterium]|nr:type II secretion system GspH family protein [Planctomycetaceae bacterium]
MRREIENKKAGFTLVELLTTMAVVGILLTLLIPALSAVQKKAVNVRQKAQFHTIELGLEAFRNDRGEYPPSGYGTQYGEYTPAERLAEALVGQDGLGFHKDSVYFQDGQSGGVALYNLSSLSQAEQQANLSKRIGPYLELESANAVQLGSIYGSGMASLSPTSFVLVDMFGKVKHLTTGKQTGMPILYYRADKTKIWHDVSTHTPDQCTYNVLESIYTQSGGSPAARGIVALPVPFSKGESHPLLDNYKAFYDATANPNFTANPRPYRAESFILHSAGHDGLYGTMDDVFNFDSEK